jgi:site-specific DNA-methyltransferase (adenine-specific)
MKLGDYEYFKTDLGVLYCGDCLDILPLIEDKVDLVLTDPNYGITQNDWDKLEDTIKCFDILIKENTIVFTCNQPSTSILINRFLKYYKWSDVWKKSQATGFLNCRAMPLRTHEDIVILSNRKVKYNPQIRKKKKENIRPLGHNSLSDNYNSFKETDKNKMRTIPNDMAYPLSIIEFNNSQNWNHPTEKPLKLFEYLLLTYSDKDDLILDPFLGSGTTAVACEKLGRRWIGIEISEKYCEIAKQRIKAEADQFKLDYKEAK